MASEKDARERQVSRLCQRCVSDIDFETGKEVKLQLPLRLAGYPQPGTEGRILMAWLCDRCGYDSSAEAFASRPEYSYTAYRAMGKGDSRFVWPPSA
jgi:hypothetical protein